MTKGQLEAKISETINKFEIEVMGKGPKKTRTIIAQDLIIVRLSGFYFNDMAQKLADKQEGLELVKKLDTMLFENASERLRGLIEELIDAKIISIHKDISISNGEKIVIMSSDADLEKRFNN